MELEIEKLKKLYLNVIPPMNVDEGFSDVLTRLKRPSRQNIYYSKIFMFTIIFSIIAIGLLGVSYVANSPNIMDAIRAKTKNVSNDKYNFPTKVQISEIKVNQKKPTPTKSESKQTPTPTPVKNNGSVPSRKDNTPTVTNNNKSEGTEKDVKGVSISKPTGVTLPTVVENNDGPGRSEDHRNNSQYNSSEKSNNGKGKSD